MSVTRLGAVATVNACSLPDSTPHDEIIAYADLAAVNLATGSVVAREIPFGEAPSRARRLVRHGDSLLPYLVNSKTWMETRPLFIGPDDVNVVYSTGFYTVSPASGVNPQYINYLLSAAPCLAYLESCSAGVTMVGYSQHTLAHMKVDLPDPKDQARVSGYLDREVTQIDALITAKQRMVDLLTVRCRMAVSHALWTTTPFREVRLKFVAGIPTSGNRDHASFTEDPDGVPCVRGVDVSGGIVDRAQILRIPVREHARHKNTTLRAGDLVIVRSGATAGAAALVPPALDGSNCVDLVIVRRSSALMPEYLRYFIQCAEVRGRILHAFSGALQPHFNAVDAGELIVPMRSLESQKDIVEELDALSRKVDRIISSETAMINLLNDRRRALITAAVTGQLDIPVAA